MKYRIVFFGTPDFSVPTLKLLIEDSRYDVVLVVTQPDRPAGRGQKIIYSPVKEIALTHGIPVLQPDNLRKNSAQLLEYFVNNNIDVGIVIAFGQILPKAVLNCPKHGCINIHASLLPRWRGAAPIQRALMAGDKKTGICLMHMETGLDTGPVYCSTEIDITPEDDAGLLHDRLASLGGKLLVEQLDSILQGKLQLTPQLDVGVTYAHKIEDQEQLINWNLPAQEILNQIRGLSPYPGAYTTLAGQRLKILKAQSHQYVADRPGQIVRCDKNQFTVQTSQNALELLELQLAGKRKMHFADFLNGTSVQQGQLLGV